MVTDRQADNASFQVAITTKKRQIFDNVFFFLIGAWRSDSSLGGKLAPTAGEHNNDQILSSGSVWHTRLDSLLRPARDWQT